MYRNVRRRLRNHEQRNRISIYLLVIMIICICYLTIENSVNKTSDISLINPLRIWKCHQSLSSSNEYIHVDFIEHTSINYSLICKESDKLLVYILSSAINVQNRESIRRTWTRKNDYLQLNETCFIFIIGLVPNDPYFPHVNIQHESSIYNDIVQLNINETYENVVYKEVAALKWSYLYVPKIPFLFKTDDDLILDSLLLGDIVKYILSNRIDHSQYLQNNKEMQRFVQQMSNVDKYTLFKGKTMGIIQTQRDGKFKIHHLAWNHDKLPHYCSGFGFLYSSFIRDRLYFASLCYEIEYVPLVGDVFVSGFLAGTASVRCSEWPLMIYQAGNNCPELFEEYPHLLVCSTPLHLKRRIYSSFDTSWTAILHRHNITTNKTFI